MKKQRPNVSVIEVSGYIPGNSGAMLGEKVIVPTAHFCCYLETDMQELPEVGIEFRAAGIVTKRRSKLFG